MTFSRPKGTRDFAPGTLEVRNAILDIIERNFQIYGYYQWDGPLFEHMETITQKCGDGIKGEIYHFEDKGGRELALRFDLTTTLARIIAQNNAMPKPIKTYNYGKNFRYEKPQAGRYREFLQIDADVFGSYSEMVEVELIMMAHSILNQINNLSNSGNILGKCYFVINDRNIVNEYLSAFGIEDAKITDVARILDKKDKISADAMKCEISALGIDIIIIDEMIEFLYSNDDNSTEKLLNILALKGADTGVIDRLIKIVETLKKATNNDIDIRIDYTLVRGQGYYTSTIYEMKVEGAVVGSIGGGGRYDELVGIYGSASEACGISFGIERLVDILQDNEELTKLLVSNKKTIYIAAEGDDRIEAIKIAEYLRSNGIYAEYDIANKSLKKQVTTSYNGYKWLLTITTGSMVLKNLTNREQIQIDDIKDIMKAIEI